MNIVLLSGGSGKRLWPLSNDFQAKQFLPIFNYQNKSESMIQRIYRQVRQIDPTSNLLVATSLNQKDILAKQIGNDVKLSIEPSRKDTFWAAVLSAAYLRDIEKKDEQEIMMLFPVDPYVQADYFQTMKKMEDLLKNEYANVGVIGLTPKTPSEKYGYIFRKEPTEISHVDRFIEKPKKQVAQQAIDNGALWDAGVFAFKIGYILQLAQNFTKFDTYQELYEKFHTLQPISFYYEICQHEKNMAVIHYPGQWIDIGMWDTLTNIMDTPTRGIVQLDSYCQNTQVINDCPKPVIGMGLDNIIIVNNPEGVLIAHRDYVDHLSDQVNKLEKNYPSITKEENTTLLEQREHCTLRCKLDAFSKISTLSLCKRNLVVTSGIGTLTRSNQQQKLTQGTSISINDNESYSIETDQGLQWIEIQYSQQPQHYKKD